MKKIFFMLLAALMLTSCAEKFDGKNGTKTVYFPDSDIVQQTVEFKNGMRNGVLKEYYRNGNLKVLQHYVNDQRNDSSLFYHENGKLAEAQFFLNQKEHGIWKKYNEQGMLYSEMSFKNGFLDSTSSEYTYRSGKLLHRWNYTEGRKHGKQEHFYSNGKPQSVAEFYYGSPKLGLKEWTESGKEINNEVKLTVEHQDLPRPKKTIRYLITPEPAKNDDKMFLINEDTNDAIRSTKELKKEGNSFILDYEIPNNMELNTSATVGLFRTTALGNMYIQTKHFDVYGQSFRP